LSGHEHNYDDVRGDGFFGQTRRERRAYPSGVCEERATKSGRKKNCRPEGCAAFGLWLRCSSVTDPLWDMLPPRAWPQATFGATNVIVIMFMTTKFDGRSAGFSQPRRLHGKQARVSSRLWRA